MRREKSLANLAAADLYAITAEELSLGRDNVTVVKMLLSAGIKVIQYREKTKHKRLMYQECLAIRELTAKAGATFIVNDCLDLALLVDADGVHVGQDDLPVAGVRRLLGPDKIIGLSTHEPSQARAAQASGLVDYLGVGPIFATQTKKDVCAPVGLSYLEFVAKNISLPMVAIGGIKLHNIAQVRAAGAKTMALVSEIVGAEDIAARIKDLRAALTRA